MQQNDQISLRCDVVCLLNTTHVQVELRGKTNVKSLPLRRRINKFRIKITADSYRLWTSELTNIKRILSVRKHLFKKVQGNVIDTGNITDISVYVPWYVRIEISCFRQFPGSSVPFAAHVAEYTPHLQRFSWMCIYVNCIPYHEHLVLFLPILMVSRVIPSQSI